MPSEAVPHGRPHYLPPSRRRQNHRHADRRHRVRSSVALALVARVRRISFLMASWLVIALGWVFYWGIGVWGNNIPVGWALDIVSYDWWMGNACGALMVSALLLLLRQYWRGALNRIAETVALLAAAAAGVYPIIHLGRSWFFYWTLPYPNDLLISGRSSAARWSGMRSTSSAC